MALSFCGKRILLNKLSNTLSIRQHGYIVLIPEIGEDLPEKNPLLHHDGLPEFNNITIEKCMAAVAKQTIDFENGVKEIETKLLEKSDNCDVFSQVFVPLEELGVPLDVTWGLSKTLYLGNSTLMPMKNYLAIHDRAKRARATKFHNATIYKCIKTNLNRENCNWTKEQGRILKKYVLEGKLNGLELNPLNKSQLEECHRKLIALKSRFKQKNDISTKQFSQTITNATIVRDFHSNLLKQIAANPANYLKGPWMINLQPHIYMPVLESCPEREIRWNLWQASVNRGSGYNNRELATGVDLEEIRSSRCDVAKLLGYETFADMSMETKMAGSVENVEKMLQTFLQRTKPYQDKELQSLLEFASNRGFKYDRIELWDVPYWRRKQQKFLYEINEDEIKNYFPLSKVLDGLFRLCENLFNIVIKQRNNVQAWHKNVKFYDIFEPDSSAPVAGFYFDPYTKFEEKMRFSSANNVGWMVSIQNQSRVTETKPLAALIFNFENPIDKNDSYLSFREIKSLFHKFGHALQHLLTKCDFSEVSGTSNIEWDAVEVSGHVLSHWLFNKNVIDSISCHNISGDTLPSEIFQNLVASNTHMAGTDLSRELYLSALDLELHRSNNYWLDVVKGLWPKYRSFPLDKNDSHPCSFSQIFIEEWGAAYYCHVWSRMIAADVYSAFHEVPNDDEQIVNVGKRFRNTFLALGGSDHPSKIFRNFRGRDPSPKALLRSLGMKKLEPETDL